MLETQISEGQHTSCHFCVDKFEGLLDKGLDLSKYELSITDPRTHFHIHYLNRDGDYIEKNVLDAYDINVDFPVIFFYVWYDFNINIFICNFTILCKITSKYYINIVIFK